MEVAGAAAPGAGFGAAFSVFSHDASPTDNPAPANPTAAAVPRNLRRSRSSKSSFLLLSGPACRWTSSCPPSHYQLPPPGCLLPWRAAFGRGMPPRCGSVHSVADAEVYARATCRINPWRMVIGSGGLWRLAGGGGLTAGKANAAGAPRYVAKARGGPRVLNGSGKARCGAADQTAHRAAEINFGEIQ